MGLNLGLQEFNALVLAFKKCVMSLWHSSIHSVVICSLLAKVKKKTVSGVAKSLFQVLQHPIINLLQFRLRYNTASAMPSFHGDTPEAVFFVHTNTLHFLHLMPYCSKCLVKLLTQPPLQFLFLFTSVASNKIAFSSLL